MKWIVDTMLMPDGLAVRWADKYWIPMGNWKEASMFMEKVERLMRHPELILVEEERR